MNTCTTPTQTLLRATDTASRLLQVGLIVLCAIAIRVPFVLVTLHRSGFNWRWGGEMFSIASAIASGHGFSSPYWISTGPTAIVAPAFPYFVAGLCYIGNGSMEFAVRAVLWLNVLFSALICAPLIAIGNRYRPRGGNLFGWCWAAFPILGHTEVVYAWDTALFALVFSTVIWLLLKLKDEGSSRNFFWWGILVGASLLLDPAHLLVIGLVLGSLCVLGAINLRQLAITAGAIALVITPWIIRNTIVFKQPTFIRSNLLYEVSSGLTTSPSDQKKANTLNPGRNPDELGRYVELGENRYMEEKIRLARQLIIDNPSAVVRRVVKRCIVFWVGNQEVTWNPWPVGNFLKHLLFTVPALVGFLGLLVFWREGNDRVSAIIFAIVLIAYPLPYYVALTSPRYRVPIEPFLVLLGAYGLSRKHETTNDRVNEPSPHTHDSGFC